MMPITRSQTRELLDQLASRILAEIKRPDQLTETCLRCEIYRQELAIRDAESAHTGARWRIRRVPCPDGTNGWVVEHLCWDHPDDRPLREITPPQWRMKAGPIPGRVDAMLHCRLLAHPNSETEELR